jgi:hypothetical protein
VHNEKQLAANYRDELLCFKSGQADLNYSDSEGRRRLGWLIKSLIENLAKQYPILNTAVRPHGPIASVEARDRV